MKILNYIAPLLIACSVAGQVQADPPEGRGWKKHHKHESYERKEEYWDGNCKVERTWKRNGDYKEERQCEGGHHYADHHHDDHHYREPEVAVVLPPWLQRESGEPEYIPERRPAPQPTASRCNSSQVGNVLGGLIGGVLGHQIGGGRGKTAATIGGAIAGVLIGGEIGRRMDARNQACIAQALEFAPAGQRIAWQDDQAGTQYAVTPGAVEKRGDQYCRPYTAEIQSGNTPDQSRGYACRREDGSWSRSSF